MQHPTLAGQRIDLVPIQDQHYDDLLAVILANPITYQYTTLGNSRASFARWFAQACLGNAFVIADKQTQRAIGSTRLYNINTHAGSALLGYSWISPDAIGTGINGEAKYLILSYAFEQLKYSRIGFEIDSDNIISQRAVEKLGATLEGKMRLHRRRLDGTLSGTCVYSILDSEWAAIKENLAQRLPRA